MVQSMEETKIEITPPSIISATIDVKERLNPDKFKTVDKIASNVIEFFRRIFKRERYLSK